VGAAGRSSASPGASATASAAAASAHGIKVSGAPSGVKAKGAVLVALSPDGATRSPDGATRQVLWGRDSTTARPMASIAKVMTALLVIQSGDLNRQLTVPKAVLNYVWKYGADSAGLVPGQKLTVHDLLEALLVSSAADAAYTLANAYGPGLTPFIAKMNAEAAALGMTHTRFTSPDGLPYPSGTSTSATPTDLLALAIAAMKSPVFRSIVDQKFYQLRKGQGHGAYWWNTTNELIGTFKGAIGIKTGFTDVAGHCLLFAAIHNGRELIGVVLGSPPTGPGAGAQDAARMLNWGFALPSR
jgi:D-alanyl-D-alanine carboxypeptidase (penicillin-binding protein 5/6)